MELFTSFLESLLKLSPIIGLLLIGLYYMYKENKELKVKNEELNLFVRQESIKNATILQSVTNTLDKVVESSSDNMDHLKEWLDLRLPKK